jgi:hypothetical protein
MLLADPAKMYLGTSPILLLCCLLPFPIFKQAALEILLSLSSPSIRPLQLV